MKSTQNIIAPNLLQEKYFQSEHGDDPQLSEEEEEVPPPKKVRPQTSKPIAQASAAPAPKEKENT